MILLTIKWAETLTDYISVFAFSGACFVVVIIFHYIGKITRYSTFSKAIVNAAAVAAAFSFLGFTIGMNVGLSLTPVVGTIIPAVLTFIAGIAAYLFFNEKYNSMNNRAMALALIISISFFIQLGDEIGAKKRMKVEAQQIQPKEFKDN